MAADPSKKQRNTAEAQLHRILYLLPAAGSEGGASVSEVAAALGVDTKQVLRDVTEVSERAFYLPAEMGAETQLAVEGDRITVYGRGAFARSPKLSAREAQALGIGLRSLAAEADPDDRQRLLDLAERLERELAWSAAKDGAGEVALALGGQAQSDAGRELRRAARERRRVRMRYLKPGGAEPETRTLEPYSLLYAERWWYVVGRCCDRDAMRHFRVDRVLGLELLDEVFPEPSGFDSQQLVPDGRAFVAAGPVSAEVRYGPRIARWIQEREPNCDDCEDGSVVVHHRVADPAWLIRHVLQYGPDAEVLSPPELRASVALHVRDLEQVGR